LEVRSQQVDKALHVALVVVIEPPNGINVLLVLGVKASGELLFKIARQVLLAVWAFAVSRGGEMLMTLAYPVRGV